MHSFTNFSWKWQILAVMPWERMIHCLDKNSGQGKKKKIKSHKLVFWLRGLGAETT